MRSKKVLILAIALLCAAFPAVVTAQSFALRVTPGLDIPVFDMAQLWLGIPETDTSAALYNLGGSLFMSGEYVFNDSFPVYAFVSAEYSLDPIKTAGGDFVHSLSGGAGGGVSFEIIPLLSLQAFAGGGYYYSLVSNAGAVSGGGNPYAFVGLGAHYMLTPVIDVGLGVSYRDLFGVYGGLRVFAGTSISLTGTEPRRIRIDAQRLTPLRAKAPDPGKGIEISAYSVDPIFPVFRNYYDDHAVGKVELVNREKVPINALKVSFFVRNYMDAPRQIDVPPVIRAGEVLDVDLYALFNASVMDITEGEKASAELSLEYKVNDVEYSDSRTRTVTLYNRNAMTWEDDRRAAAFVTRFDPVVQEYAKNLLAAIDGMGSEAVDKAFLGAIGVHQTLQLSGIKYAVDPKSAYSDLAAKKREVDYLQFPRQTLQRKGGDCDDLSILYCALLESVGIPTAFVTVPGHIFIAFALDIDPKEAKKLFSAQSDLFEKNGKIWVPIEVTERSRGFVEAWKTGSREWRQGASALGFFPLQEAWKTYAPVQSPEKAGQAVSGIVLPAAADIAKSVAAEVDVFREGEVSTQVEQLRKQVNPKTGNPKVQNKIGILYARYGLYSKAEAEFLQLTSDEQTAYTPALVNLGNLKYLKEDYEGAAALYTKAAKKAPADATVQLCLARACYALGKTDQARAVMTAVRKLEPRLAEQYAFIESGDSTVRAADAAKLKGVAVWDE